VLLLCGCHAVLAIDPPPRSTGKTVLVLRAQGGVVQTVHVLDGTLPVLELPAFSRQGDTDLAVVELKCPPGVLGLALGPLTLADMPDGERKLPKPLSVQTMTIRGDDASGWDAPAEGTTWITSALDRIPAPKNLPCALRGFDFSYRRLQTDGLATLVELPDRTALVLTSESIARIDSTGTLTPIDLQIGRVLTATTTLVGVRDPNGELWTIDSDGRLAHAPIGRGTLTYVASAPGMPGWTQLVRDERGGLYASKKVYNQDSALDIAHYDRLSDRWTPLFHLEAPMGFGLISTYPLDHSVLVAGADFRSDPGRVFGQGRLLEIDPTSSGTVTLTWSQLPSPDTALRAIPISFADTQLFGRTLGVITCVDGTMGCSVGTNRGGLRGIVMRQVDGTWQKVEKIATDYPITTLADAGPDAVWIGGIRDFRYEGVVTAHFADGLACPLYRDGIFAPQIVGLADGVWAVASTLDDESMRDIVDLYTPTSEPNDCAESL